MAPVDSLNAIRAESSWALCAGLMKAGRGGGKVWFDKRQMVGHSIVENFNKGEILWPP